MCGNEQMKGLLPTAFSAFVKPVLEIAISRDATVPRAHRLRIKQPASFALQTIDPLNGGEEGSR